MREEKGGRRQITKEKEEIAMILTGTMEENCVLQKHAKYKSQLNNKQYKI